MRTEERETLTETLESAIEAQEKGARVCVPNMGTEERETLTETLELAVQGQEYGAMVSVPKVGTEERETLSETLELVVQGQEYGAMVSVPKVGTEERVTPTETLEPAVEAQKNGARVYVEGVDGVKDNVYVGGEGGVVIEAGVVEVCVESSFVLTDHGDGRIIEDAKEIGNAVGAALSDGDSTSSTGDGSRGEMGLNQNGASVGVEVPGLVDSVNEKRKNCGYVDNKVSVAGNGGTQGEEVVEIPGWEGKGNFEASHDEEENNGEGEEDVGDDEHEYSVGDFVWGKIRSHPWWPGRIYNPADASEYARQYGQVGKLLVAYFGDESFSWCCPSQLKPFAQDFEEMSAQSNSKSFVNAVQNAVDEMGKLVGFKMTCYCIPDKERIGFERDLAVNAGIKEGVLVPDCDVNKLLFFSNVQSELLSTLRSIAKGVFNINVPGLMVLTNWLSAFYRAKGVHKLPLYYEPVPVEGLEDKKDGLVQVPFGGPVEEVWISSSVHPGLDQADQSSLQQCSRLAEDKLYERRKEKTVAELIEEDMVVKPDNEIESLVKDVIKPGKLVKTSGKEKGEGEEETKSVSSVGRKDANVKEETKKGLASGIKRGRKKRVETQESAEKKVPRQKNGAGSEEGTKKKGGMSRIRNENTNAKEETEKCLVSVKKRAKKKAKTQGTEKSAEMEVDSAENGDVEGDNALTVRKDDSMCEEETEKVFASRERKKSKYLSPPFTSVKRGVRNSSTDKESLDAESEKMARIVNPSDETKVDKAAISTPNLTRGDQEEIVDCVKLNVPPKEVVHELRSAAINPLHLKEKIEADLFSDFISEFRGAHYLKGSKYKIFHRGKPGRKRKLRSSEHDTKGYESQRKRNRKNEKELSGVKKLEKDGGELRKETVDTKKESEAATMPVTLIVTFPSGFSLPSNDDLKAVFSKFGALNEKETEVLCNRSCAVVVFVKSSDAVKACNVSIKESPFGPAKVGYRLRYSVDPSKDGGESPLLFTVKEKLELMTSMLEKSDGSMLPEDQSKLEVEMKGLLEVVNTVI